MPQTTAPSPRSRVTAPAPASEGNEASGGGPEFGAFVARRRPMLLRAARSMTPSPNDAEDLLQTALVKTFQAWDRIADPDSIEAYLRRVLINTRTSLWRHRRLVDEFLTDQVPELPGPTGGDPAEQQAQRDAVWSAVLRLPARQRAMIVLRYYEDLTEAQTAAVLGVSRGTVKSSVSRALAKLRAEPELSHQAWPDEP